MANNVNKMSPEAIANEKRKRQLAILKASNEMLAQAKETAMKKVKDPMKRAELDEQFNQAIQENGQRGKNYLHASQEEIDGAEFREVEDYYVEKYQERLKVRGLNDEELHRKEVATITVGKKGKKEDGKIARRPRKGSKAYEKEIERIDGEEELMKLSMVKSDEDIERQREKNRQFEEEMKKNGHTILVKTKEKMKEVTDSTKVRVNDENVGHVEINVEKNEDITSKKVYNVPTKTNDFSNDTIMDEIAEVKHRGIKKEDIEVVTYDFDFSSIPSYVQYDVIPLPSKGKCYPVGNPLRCGHVPVAYLTAADENIIVSPNVYRDGKLFDILLERKVLDKRINVNDLVSGDRDAIILWLRATSYGVEFPVSVTNPKTQKEYKLTIDLSQFKYNEFNLNSDDDGLFTFMTENGDEIKFNFLTTLDEDKIKKIISSQIVDNNRVEVLKSLRNIEQVIGNIDLSEEDLLMINEDVSEIKEIIDTDFNDENIEMFYPSTLTEQMILHTVSVDGNDDREFIRNYIENMRTKEAKAYRDYYIKNTPGVDLNFDVNIPESDGGGSFSTFLRLTSTIFINF